MQKEVHNKTGTFETHKDCSRGQDKNVQDQGNTKFVELSVKIYTSNLYSISKWFLNAIQFLAKLKYVQQYTETFN